MTSQGDALKYASADLQNDRGIVETAIRSSGRALQHASQELRADSAVVKAAVDQCWFAFEYADQTLLSNREVVAHAVHRSYSNFTSASAELKRDPEVILSMLTSEHAWSHVLSYIAEDILESNREIAMAAVMMDASSMFRLRAYSNDREIALAALTLVTLVVPFV